PEEREAAGGGELPRPGPRRPAEQRLGPPEPREHPARGGRPRERARRVRPPHATLSERRGGVGGAGRCAREDGPGRRRLAGVHGGAPEEPGGRGHQRRILELEAAKTAQPDILEDLVGIKGIGKTRAKALIDAGFQTAEDFTKASLKDLMVVKGITRKIAEDLTEHFRASLAEAR